MRSDLLQFRSASSAAGGSLQREILTQLYATMAAHLLQGSTGLQKRNLIGGVLGTGAAPITVSPPQQQGAFIIYRTSFHQLQEAIMNSTEEI
jgi:hypothetical protein